MKPIVVSSTSTSKKKESCWHSSSSAHPRTHHNIESINNNNNNNNSSKIFRRSRLPSNDNTLPAHNLRGKTRRTRSIGCISSGSCQSSLLIHVLKRSTSFIVTPENPHSAPYTMDAFDNPFLEEPTETTTITLDSVSSLSHDSARRLNPNASEGSGTCPPPPIEIVVQLQRSYSEPMSLYQSGSLVFEQREPSNEVEDDLTVEDWQQGWIDRGPHSESQPLIRPPQITIETLERSYTDATSPCTCTGTVCNHRPTPPITPQTTVSEYPALLWAKHQRFLDLREIPSLDHSHIHDHDTHNHHQQHGHRGHRQTKSCGDPTELLGNRPKRIIRRPRQLVSIGNVVGESTMDSSHSSRDIPQHPKEFRKFMKNLKLRHGMMEENDFFHPPRKSLFTRELELAWQRMKTSVRITNSADKLALQRSHTGCLA